MKNIVKKILNFFKTIGDFLKEEGYTKIIYILLFIYFFLTGAKLLAGAAGGIFIYINYNIIRDRLLKFVKKDSNKFE
jgi:hypothetical protein